MSTFLRLTAFILISGFVSSVIEAAPVNSIHSESSLLSSRALSSAQEKCAARYRVAPKGGSGGSHRESSTLSPTSLKVKKIGRAIEDNSLYPRVEQHQSPKEPLILYHGTLCPQYFEVLDLKKLPEDDGDFHFDKAAFYMTDVKINAIQYECKRNLLESTDKVTVVILHWEGSENVHMFKGLDDPEWKEYVEWIRKRHDPRNPTVPHPRFEEIHNMDMVAGPMHAAGDILDGINRDFWQYALTNIPAAEKKLKKVTTELVPCGDQGRRTLKLAANRSGSESP